MKLSLLCVHVEMFSEVETPSEFPPKIEKRHKIRSMHSVSFILEMGAMPIRLHALEN